MKRSKHVRASGVTASTGDRRSQRAPSSLNFNFMIHDSLFLHAFSWLINSGEYSGKFSSNG